MASRRRAVSSSAIAVALLVIAGAIPVSLCQGGGVNETLTASPTSTAFLLQYIDGLIVNLTATFEPLVKQHLGFCISDPHRDIHAAFNFSIDQTFLVQCAANTSDLTNRICTAAEIKSYFSSFFASRGAITYLEPNKNCNFNTWGVGCEPGWSCRIGTNQNLSYIDSETIPSRIDNCEPVCEGFFSPYGITCMIPCPLGAYCPRATLNESTGTCDPYNYQPSPGIRNHTCGGANIWADVQSSGNIFCPEGYYCPSTIQKKPCEDGYYCRKGSTYEASCFKSSSCKPKSANQDIKLFGGLVMVALSLLLVIIYNFHNQIISTREKKQAKSRESAMKTVREAVLARQRWKAARIAAISRAYGLRNQISRKFSRNWTSKQTELATSHDQNNNILAEYINEDEEERILRNRNHSSEVNSDFFEVILENSIETNYKKDIPKGKHKRNRTQIFKYAYDQIEKEKVMQEENKNLTFSGVVTMATEKEIRSRPLVEVAFKDLTLILKRNKKTLLKCVTGKLKPGHITAVMGPSGAGKTTFLTALAGKTAGCDVTGLVLINGKVEPIQSYKKIIGFVPQDDIVHGNLTVEENIWFSARCRLSADMPKADKILVVERTIESLGLQAVRNSLVGTVEKRGISGGQRKRVNVGLEMVMEPSLLILDEPTSGLDSSSSLLLLRALRREALEGVNICLVVHQPSYSLFNMFDELVLLAKGGFIVYHGPVKKVEDYFAGLGIHVPDRANPPDHFIDILEGIVKPGSSISVTCNQLPIIWMLRNGYEIPQDMQHDLESVDASLREGGTSFARLVVDQHTGSSETWENFKGALDEKKHRFLFNFTRSKDLTNRRTPGILMQYKLYLGRIIKQRLREARIQVIDLLILCLAGVCLGLLAKINDETLGVAGYSYTTIAVSLLCKIASLRSFSLEKLQFIRERASGMSSLAYFLAKDTVDHFNTIVKPIVYLSMFYFLNAPRSTFTDNYIVLIALVYCVSGIGYTFAICFQPGSAQLWGALLPVVLTLISTRPNVSDILRNVCYPKWVLEAFVVANARKYPGVWLITRCGLLMKAGYNINDWGLCIAILFLYGFVFRLIAFICLVILQKK